MSFEETAPNVPRPRWAEWVERNAQPKNYYFPRVRRELTRWQKRGPMQRKDWVRFYHWAAQKAIPIDEDMIKEHLAAKYAKWAKKHGPVEVDDKKKKKKSPKIKSLAELLKRVELLSVQLPRKASPKYDYPPEPNYPYSPQIDMNKPATKDPGRPIVPPKVPKCFQHIDIETDFWSKLRFSIQKGALKYTPSENVRRLAKPRVVPPEHPHCPLPEVVPEVIPKRQRMTYRQWREHMRRLEYLAKPVMRPRTSFCC